jgi:dihydrofolate reductase
MAQVIVTNHVTLDGVMQAPGRPDEDTRGGFAHGGWAAPRIDEVMAGVMAKGMADPGPLLLGRRTYEDFYGFWPKQTDNPFTPLLNQVRKYVVSTTLSEPLPWTNSALIAGDVAEAVSELKRESEKDIGVLGSGELIGTLQRAGLIDRYVLMIHPLVLGSGKRLFGDDGTFEELGLVDSVTTTTGVLIATYQRGRA